MTAYANRNFKTKKALKEALTQYMHDATNYENAVRCHQAGLDPDLSNYTGRVALSGPHYPAAHTWHAECEMVNGVVVKVK